MTTSIGKAAGDNRPVRSALLSKLCGENGLYALGASIARVVEMASSDDEGAQSLTYYVLSDAALAQRILRLANATMYRIANGSPVTTVSRAIALLGFDNVKMAALAMLLVDTLANSAHAASVRNEIEKSLCASLIGREIARRGVYRGEEEASTGALLKNIGPLLTASYEHERFLEIKALASEGKHSTGQASQMILGCSFDALSIAILQEWGIPDAIVRTLGPLPQSGHKTAVNRAEWIRQVVAFSGEAASILVLNGTLADGVDMSALYKRFGATLNVSRSQILDIGSSVAHEMTELLQSMGISRQVRPAAVAVEEGLPDVLMLATMDSGDKQANAAFPSGKPANARDLLLAAVLEVTQARSTGLATDDFLLIVLQALKRSMGFRFATVCLKDQEASVYRARVSIGQRREGIEKSFCFPATPTTPQNDLFRLSMANNADLVIADANAPKIRALLPAWHRDVLDDVQSLMVLPLVVNQVQIGFLYADRIHLAPEGITPEETTLILAMKTQVLQVLTAARM